MKTVWIWQKNRHTDLRNRIYNAKIHKYNQFSERKEQRQFSEKRMAFSTNDTQTIQYLYAKKYKDFIPFTKINLQWIIELNVKYKVLKLLEDSIGGNLGNLEFSLDIFRY